jgi:hypothetical protein
VGRPDHENHQQNAGDKMNIKVAKTKAPGIIQITTLDERWYLDQNPKDPAKPEVPSVTWFSGYTPKGIGFYKWLAMKGWDESQAIKQAAGDKGSKVHHAIDAMIDGGTVNMSDQFADSEGVVSPLEPEEWECVMAFHAWWKSMKAECKKKGITFEVLAKEQVVWRHPKDEKDMLCYAGTMDLKIRIGDKIYIIDFKTSQDIWLEYEVQVTAYKHADGNEDVTNLAILQIGYRKNERHWKFNDIEDKPRLMEAAYSFWWDENKDKKPAQKDYPIALSLIDDEVHLNLQAELDKINSALPVGSQVFEPTTSPTITLDTKEGPK